MKIVIMRHGDATFSNSDRILSEQGIEEVEKIASYLSSIVKIDRCLCSPKTRAMQTAGILKYKVFDCDVEIERMLTPSGDPVSLVSYLDAIIKQDKNLLIVSHLPLVELLAYELHKRMKAPPLFDTACALVLDYDGKNANYEAFVSPEFGIEYLI